MILLFNIYRTVGFLLAIPYVKNINPKTPIANAILKITPPVVPSKCENALEKLDSVLISAGKEYEDKLSSLLGEISVNAYLGKITNQLKDMDYRNIETWFLRIVTQVFEEFAPHFGIVE